MYITGTLANVLVFEVGGAYTHYPNFLPPEIKWIDYYFEWKKYLRQVPIALAIMIDENLENTLVVRSWNRYKWAFPGGKIEYGESFPDCVKREVYEELSVDICDKASDDLCFEYSDDHREKRFFIIEGISPDIDADKLQPYEVEELQWINPFDFHIYERKSMTLIHPYLRFLNFSKVYKPTRSGQPPPTVDPGTVEQAVLYIATLRNFRYNGII
ncbi:hypothetical protein ACTXT7_006760 [Hymenolepis weldensis]